MYGSDDLGIFLRKWSRITPSHRPTSVPVSLKSWWLTVSTTNRRPRPAAIANIESIREASRLLTLQPEDRDDERVEGAEDTTLILQAADNGGSEVGFSQLLPRSGHVAQLYY